MSIENQQVASICLVRRHLRVSFYICFNIIPPLVTIPPKLYFVNIFLLAKIGVKINVLEI